MATDRMTLLEYARKVSEEGDADLLREAVRVMAQAIMETEVSELTGPGAWCGSSSSSWHRRVRGQP